MSTLGRTPSATTIPCNGVEFDSQEDKDEKEEEEERERLGVRERERERERDRRTPPPLLVASPPASEFKRPKFKFGRRGGPAAAGGRGRGRGPAARARARGPPAGPGPAGGPRRLSVAPTVRPLRSRSQLREIIHAGPGGHWRKGGE